ncbi:hypothetical protein DSCW_01190 [Desulfosarcina widdelii]|uniref:Uncharacterized protein n=1 Tax=Desulfosarcina widdelii TaxID=947919 RepID=A0A5K7YS94_9BACT|nr:hypothetical protein [Desulfosarcina widdelii]BBO72702.1 hypothetical protein DSCW_01190 [Desulfosarcina widdelii]
MNRRLVIKKMITTAVSFTIGMPLVLEFIFFVSHCDENKKNLSFVAIIEKTIDHLYIKDGFVDLVTLSTELLQNGQLEMIGGMENLLFIIDRYNLYDRLN